MIFINERVAKDDLSNPHDFKERTYQGILQIMAFFPCKSSIISLIYDLVKVWYVLRWHQATTSALRYGTTTVKVSKFKFLSQQLEYFNHSRPWLKKKNLLELVHHILQFKTRPESVTNFVNRFQPLHGQGIIILNS